MSQWLLSVKGLLSQSNHIAKSPFLVIDNHVEHLRMKNLIQATMKVVTTVSESMVSTEMAKMTIMAPRR